MITEFLLIIAAAELQGHKPGRENAGGTHIYFTFQRDTFLYQTPLISITCMFCFMNSHTTRHGHLWRCCVTSQTNLINSVMAVLWLEWFQLLPQRNIVCVTHYSAPSPHDTLPLPLFSLSHSVITAACVQAETRSWAPSTPRRTCPGTSTTRPASWPPRASSWSPTRGRRRRADTSRQQLIREKMLCWDFRHTDSRSGGYQSHCWRSIIEAWQRSLPTLTRGVAVPSRCKLSLLEDRI